MPSSFDFGMLVERGRDLFQRKHIAPRGLDGVNRRAAAFHHIFHARAENAVDADDHFIARFDEIGGDAFHSGHAGAADRKGERILRAKHLTQELARLVHDREILRIEVPEGRRTERAQDALRDGARPRAEENAFSGVWVSTMRSMI